eukprot:14370732-Ditylum_brightwellii.AAC.1
MSIGRWSSDVFLCYIRKQIQEFTMGISGKMLLTLDFYTVPDEGASGKDPRTPGNPENFTSIFFGADYCNQAIRATFATHY